ncbi:minor capsid protein [Streptomyces sp. CC208A]|uniref:minor capsid protein n=1 Tax=Streptomyces sp. CC208A TaxID=3044573 RepID=UPI0024A8492D|nr:minor capsid protein [Streptomyces sp. CC208A]
MSGYTTSLLGGLGVLIDGAGIAVWRPDGVIGPGETGLYSAVVPPEPDRAIGMTTYPVEDTDLTDAITGVQFRLRAGRNPDDVNDLADSLFDLLHNRQHYQLAGIHVALSWRQSQAWIGQDDHGRMELTSNFYFRTTRPGPNLFD